jgi:hypothetical protein
MMKNTTNEKLVDAVLEHLAAVGGVEAVSYLQKVLREDGWRGLGCLADFEDRMRELGFTVREGRNSRSQRRIEVSI